MENEIIAQQDMRELHLEGQKITHLYIEVNGNSQVGYYLNGNIVEFDLPVKSGSKIKYRYQTN